MKKKVICVMLAMMLVGCGKTTVPVEKIPEAEQTSVQQTIETEAMEENKSEVPTVEDTASIDDVFENDEWKEMYEYTTEMIDSLMDQIDVTYADYPKPYPFISKDNGAENGGYPPYTVKYENGQLIIDEEDSYREEHYRITLSDYENGCFEHMLVGMVDSDGNQLEMVEEHDHDAFMKEFRDSVRERKVYLEENVYGITDIQQNDVVKEYGLEEKERVSVGKYEVISYTNELYGNNTVFMEILLERHIVATIKDWATLAEWTGLSHVISFYNYEEAEVYRVFFEDKEDEIYKYDEYGNCIYYSDICNWGETEYDFADEDYLPIIRQCEEILCHNGPYRQNWK